ncbi:WD40 repeat-like protein [Cryphonectria parasitica EP155]|uniref:Ribosome biogenesis protein YTM1 n=1 Tax=Cryphonectria parasitica (strain ATCC 38755 / EP155) TaxID=660469 RepID=A0A9P4YE51_CRYP1|nr:WD40 repeat-like protein [Cryphonectria parasitica EP155]KAF3770895.1 WD40 repeat-like protein [Cryphonectria parasitica EP155]
MAQIKVTFTTTEDGFELPESRRQLLVPADIKRLGLSRILNSESMLDTPQPVPFDFLINGTFLTSTLEEYLEREGLSFETNITLQYVRSLIPPQYEASFEHDDWVSAVDVLSSSSPAGVWSVDSFTAGHDRILSASYDGLLRIWNGSGDVIATSPAGSHGGHSASVKAARFLSNSQIASAGLDRTVRVWKYTEAGDQSSGELKPTLELYGHRSTIDSLEVDGTSRRILTASADGSIGLWSTSKASAPQAPVELLPGSTHASKRRKLASSVSAPQRGALHLAAFHKAPATAAVFDPRDLTVAYSAGQDHDLHTIDLTTMVKVNTIPASSALLSLCAVPGPSGSPLLAAGTSSRNVVLVDPRESQARTSVMTLRGHVNKVVSLARCPENEHSLVSGSHDGTCRIWDLRSVRPATKNEDGAAGGGVSEAVYVIERETKGGRKRPLAGEGCKVFSVVWDQTWGIVSGGEDKRVQINRGRDIIAS